MANNRIQIKRSTSNSTVTGLLPGELAFTQSGNTLHIGLPDGSGIIRVGGRQVPGTLTNNQALVANSIGAIDKVITANLVPTKLFANGRFGGAGEVLAADAIGDLYWVDPGTLEARPAGQNTWVQFNGSNVLAASVGFTFNSDSNTLFVGNTLTIGTGTVAYINSTSFSGIANDSIHLGGFFANAYVKAQDDVVFTGNVQFTGKQLSVAVTSFDISSNVNVGTGKFINAVGSNIRVNDAEINGNLSVLGTVTTINTTSITIKDNLVEFASGNETTDIIDSGWFSPAGGGGNKWYSGIARIASKSSPTNPFFKLYGTATNPNTNPTVDPGASIGTLQAYLAPYGVGGAFNVDNNSIDINANSSVSVNITANTLSVGQLILTAPLPVVSGGTGRNSVTKGGVFVGNSTSGFDELLLGADGAILQSNGTSLVYSTLDGGLF
jgi:hypothetical protein